jgi:peptidoglycan hydrolase CwlO-like protein
MKRLDAPNPLVRGFPGGLAASQAVPSLRMSPSLSNNRGPMQGRALVSRTVVLAVAFVLACAGLAAMAPGSAASTSSKLDEAKRRLSALTTSIISQEAAATDLENKLATLGTQIESASRRENALASSLVSTRKRIDAATSRAQDLQGQIDTVAQTLFMQGGLQGGFLEPLLSSSSMADFSDRLAFAQAVGQSSVDLANQVADARALLDIQAKDLSRLQAEQIQLLADLNKSRLAQSQALAQHQQVLDQLSRTKDQIVSLIIKLHLQLLAEQLGVGTAFQGPGHISYGGWAGDFLNAMGVPGCHENKVAVVAWQYSEFTQAAWNPLATTHPMPGSTYFNGSGVQNYPSLASGLEASRQTILSGLSNYGYGAILDSLSACSSAMTTGLAINASFWCRGCTYGHYVIGNILKVEAHYEVYAAL